MKITTLGCGNAFSKKNFNQSFLVEENGRRMLIDCGSLTPQALDAANIDLKSISDIYISHAHADHCGGLENVAFARYDWSRHPRTFNEYPDHPYAPKLIGNKMVLEDLWNKSLRGGLESMEGFVATMDTFFEPNPVEPNRSFDWEGWKVDLIQQIHILSGSTIMPSFGIMFRKEGHKSVYFVTDSQHCSPRQMEEYYKQADIIYQDCECTGVNFQFKEGDKVFSYKDEKGVLTYPWPSDDMEALELGARGTDPQYWECFKFGSGVHANYAQLAGYPSANSVRLSADIKKKMKLSHYQDFVLANKDMFGNDVNWEEMAKEDGFAGFTHVGEVVEI